MFFVLDLCFDCVHPSLSGLSLTSTMVNLFSKSKTKPNHPFWIEVSLLSELTKLTLLFTYNMQSFQLKTTECDWQFWCFGICLLCCKDTNWSEHARQHQSKSKTPCQRRHSPALWTLGPTASFSANWANYLRQLTAVSGFPDFFSVQHVVDSYMLHRDWIAGFKANVLHILGSVPFNSPDTYRTISVLF